MTLRFRLLMQKFNSLHYFLQDTRDGDTNTWMLSHLQSKWPTHDQNIQIKSATLKHVEEMFSCDHLWISFSHLTLFPPTIVEFEKHHLHNKGQLNISVLIEQSWKTQVAISKFPICYTPPLWQEVQLVRVFWNVYCNLYLKTSSLLLHLT